MKMNIKGLVFVGFAAAVFASAANAAIPEGDAAKKAVTSVSFTETTYEKKANKVEAFTETNKNSTTLYPSNAAVTAALAANGGAVNNSTITIKKNGTSVGTFTVNQAADGDVNIAVPTTVAELTDSGNYELITNKTQTVAATGSTSNDKYPSETAVRAAITAAAGDYQTKSTVAQQVSDGAGGWQNLTTDATPTANSTNPVQSGGVASALANKEDESNKVTSLSSSSTDTEYPSAKAVWDLTHGIALPEAPTGADACTDTAPCALVLGTNGATWEKIQQ